MTNEFIPYKEALALKELGFEGECFGYYNSFGRFIDDKVLTQEGDMPSAPLYQQAFRWFREEYDIQSYIKPLSDKTWGVYAVNGRLIFNIDRWGHHIVPDYMIFNTYKEAELACLRKLIEIVNQNKEDDI